MGIHALKTGKFRVQVRKKGLAPYDKVFDTLAEAEAALAERERLTSRARAADSTLREVWDLFVSSTAWHNLAESTQSTYKQNVRPVLEELGDYSLAVLADNTEIVRRHFDARTREGRANETVRLEIASLSAAVAFAKARGYISYNFVRQVDRPSVKRRVRRVAPVEKAGLQVAALSDRAAAQHARFNLILGYVGCRPGELAKVLKADINLPRSEITFRGTKNRRSRCVHLPSEAHGLVRTQFAISPAESPYLFSRRTRAGAYAPYSYNNGHRQLKRNGVVDKTYHPHAMRREFISRAIEQSIPLTTLKHQTGHKSTQALEAYDEACATAPEVRAVFEAMTRTQKDDMLVAMAQQLGMSREDLERVFGVKVPDPSGLISFEERVARKRRPGT